MDFGSWDWVGKEETPTFDIQSLFHPRRLEELKAPKNEISPDDEQGDPKMRLQWSRCVSRFAALRAEISNCWDEHHEATHILKKMRKELQEHTNSLVALQPASEIDPIPIKGDDDAMCKSTSHIEAFEELNRALQSGNVQWLEAAIELCRNVKVHENKLQPALKRLDKWESLRDGRAEAFSLPENVEDNGKSARARSGLRRAMTSRDWKIVKKALQDAECLLCSDEKIMIAAREELAVLEARKDASNAIQRALKSRNADELKEAINLCVWSDYDDGIISKARAALQTEMSQLAAREKLKKAMASDNIEVLAGTIEETSNNLLDDPENELGEARKRLAILKASKTLREAARLGNIITLERAIEHAARTGVGAMEISRAETELSRLRVRALLETEDPSKIRTALKRLDSTDSMVLTLRSRLAMLERKKVIYEAKPNDYDTIQNALNQAREEGDSEVISAAETALDRIKTRMADDVRDAMENDDIDRLELLVVETEPVLKNYPIFHSAKAQVAGRRGASQPSFLPRHVKRESEEMRMAEVAREVTHARNLLFEEEKKEATEALQEAIVHGSISDLEYALAEGEDKMVDEEYVADGMRVLRDRSGYTGAGTFGASFQTEDSKMAVSAQSMSLAKPASAHSSPTGKQAFSAHATSPVESHKKEVANFLMNPYERSDEQESPLARSVNATERARARIEAKDAISQAMHDYAQLELAVERGREAGLTVRELQDATDALENFRVKAAEKKYVADMFASLEHASKSRDVARLRELIAQSEAEGTLTGERLLPFIEVLRDMEAQIEALGRMRARERVQSDLQSLASMPVQEDKIRACLAQAEELGMKDGKSATAATMRLQTYRATLDRLESSVSLDELRDAVETARLLGDIPEDILAPFLDALLQLERHAVDTWVANVQQCLEQERVDVEEVRRMLDTCPDTELAEYANARAVLQADEAMSAALASHDDVKLQEALQGGLSHHLDVRPVADALKMLELGQQLAVSGSLDELDEYIGASLLEGDHPIMRDVRARRSLLEAATPHFAIAESSGEPCAADTEEYCDRPVSPLGICSFQGNVGAATPPGNISIASFSDFPSLPNVESGGQIPVELSNLSFIDAGSHLGQDFDFPAAFASTGKIDVGTSSNQPASPQSASPAHSAESTPPVDKAPRSSQEDGASETRATCASLDGRARAESCMRLADPVPDPPACSTGFSANTRHSDESYTLERDEASRTLLATMRSTQINEVALNTALMVARKLGLDSTDRGMREIAEAEEALVKHQREKVFLEVVYSKDKGAILRALKDPPSRELAVQAEAMLENIEQEEIQKALDEVQAEDTSPPTALAVEVGPSQWQCGACSFVNENTALACIICLSPNPEAPATPAQPRQSADGSWVCSQCTYENGTSRRRCEICGANNPSVRQVAAMEPWTCPACTMGENTTPACATCGTPHVDAREANASAIAPHSFSPTANPALLQRVPWASLRPGDHVKAKVKMKWNGDGSQIPASRTGSAFKVVPGTLGTYIGVRDSKLIIEWLNGRTTFFGAVEVSQVDKL